MPIMSEKARALLNRLMKDYDSGNLARVVRCKDCIYRHDGHFPNNKPYMECKMHDRYVRDDMYCSWGVGKADESTIGQLNIDSAVK